MENVMFNYMNCNQMMFGSKVKYSVTYKTNQRSFDIYRRKYWHDFKVPVSDENLEQSIGLELKTMGAYLVSKIDKVIIYDSQTFHPIDQIPITLLKADTREPNQVIAIQKSVDEQYVAIISGKLLIMDAQFCNQLFIFKRIPQPDGVLDKFELHKRVVVREIPEFRKVCLNFFFKANGKNDTIIFTKVD